MIDQWTAETREAAAHPEHPWDRAALDWVLTAQSVVVEVGGYKGRWALQIAERYAPRLFVFEPQQWAADVCRAVLGARALVLGCALGVSDAPMRLRRFGTDGCALTETGGEADAEVREIGRALASLGLDRIDLMLMNIEGYEHTLIPHMLARGVRPEALMVQWHGGAPDAIDGYRLLWDYGETLQAWVRS